MLGYIVSNYLAAQFDVSRWLLTRLVKNSLIEAAFIIVLRFSLKNRCNCLKNTCDSKVKNHYEVMNLFSKDSRCYTWPHRAGK